MGRNKFVDYLGSHTPIKIGTKEQRENWDIRRKGRVAKKWGGKAGAEEMAELDIQNKTKGAGRKSRVPRQDVRY